MGAPYGDHIDPNRFSGTQEHHAEYLIRTCLRYEVLEAALDHTLAMMRRVSAPLRTGFSARLLSSQLSLTALFGSRPLRFRPSSYRYTAPSVLQSDSRLTDELAKTAGATWLPYTLIDQVLVAADSQTDLSPRGRSVLGELRAEIASRMKRVQKFSQASA